MHLHEKSFKDVLDIITAIPTFKKVNRPINMTVHGTQEDTLFLKGVIHI
jgi:hypothetical protein